MVSPELRAAEREIENVPLRNALVEQPFSQAAWRFMAANEERVMREIVKPDQTGTSKHDQYYAARQELAVNGNSKGEAVSAGHAAQQGPSAQTSSSQDLGQG